MATTAFKGQTVNTVADLPEVGSALPSFTLVKTDLSELTSDELKGKKFVLNIFPVSYTHLTLPTIYSV